jgi:hypothetical protein
MVTGLSLAASDPNFNSRICSLGVVPGMSLTFRLVGLDGDVVLKSFRVPSGGAFMSSTYMYVCMYVCICIYIYIYIYI